MLWKKDKKQEKQKPAKIEPAVKEQEKDSTTDSRNVDMSKFRNFESGVLKGFYVSEKASVLNSMNQYVFKVFDNATKNEVKKQVEKSFEVKVKGIKMINLPRKTRNVGRHSGFKPGLKKAIVALKEGYSIDQAKP